MKLCDFGTAADAQTHMTNNKVGTGVSNQINRVFINSESVKWYGKL